MINIAWAAEPAKETVKVTADINAWHAIASASPVVQLTLISLVGMSITSWAIFFQKRKQFEMVEEANVPFEDMFWKASSLEDIHDRLKDFPNSNLAAVFRMGYIELRKMAESTLGEGAKGDDMHLSGIDNLQRALRKAVDIEISRLEGRLTFLATVGSVGPFVGLFGTVWGIMSSFQRIGQTGMASLAVVAPGIAEALIATGVGLAAAIPATITYNWFIGRIRKQELALNNFSADFLNLAKRNFFKGS